MSWLEFGLSLYILLLLIAYAVWGGRGLHGKKLAALLGAGVLLLTLQLAIDGYRLQMLIIYLVLAIISLLLLVFEYRRYKARHVQTARLSKRAALASIGALLLVIAVLIPLYVMPKVDLPQPTGPHMVGTAIYSWVDEQRLETYTPAEGDYREVAVRIWYPAEPEAVTQRAPYAYEREQLDRLAEDQPIYIQALLAAIRQAEAHSYLQAPVSRADSHYPVLVLSPGFGMSNFMYAGLTEELASYGYIVAAVEHPYYAEIPTMFTDGRIAEGIVNVDIEALEWDMGEHVQLWAEDVRFVLDRLEALNMHDPLSILTGKLDISRIGMLGHSFGGAAAAQVMNQDERVLAGVNMDGYPYGERLEHGLSHPFLFMLTSDTDNFGSLKLSEKEWREYGSRAVYEQQAEDFTQRKNGILKNGGTEWVVQGADHMSFSDMGLYSPLLGSYDRNLQKEINKKLLQFFDAYVRK